MAGKHKYIEQELIALLRQGSKEAFNVLYDNYSPALFGIVSRIVNSEETAQDVLQDAFVKIWKNIAGYDSSKGSLFTWMLNIARNTAIDASRTRHEKNQIRGSSPLVSITEEARVEMNFDHMGIQEVILTLKPEQKLMIEYLYMNGFTQEETAKELNMPLGTVKTRARAAIMKLRELLKEKQIGY